MVREDTSIYNINIRNFIVDMDENVVERYSYDKMVAEIHKVVKDVELHYHDCYEIEIVTEGSCRHIINGKDSRLNKGDLIFLSPSDIHEIILDGGDITVANIKFIETDISEKVRHIMYNTELPVCASLGGSDYSKLLGIFCGILSNGQLLENELMEAFACCQLEAIIILISDIGKRYNTVLSVSECGDRGISYALTYVKRYFRKKITVAEVASLCHYSPNYFGAIFKRQTGKPFIKYLNDMRLEFAHNLIAHSNFSVNEIYLNSGFESASYFTRLFKSKYSVSPSQIRANTVDL